MNAGDIRPGDKLRILEWDELKERYISDDDMIYTDPATFVCAMKYMCGRIITADHVNGGCVVSVEGTEGSWYLPAQACEPALNPLEETEISIEAIMF